MSSGTHHEEKQLQTPNTSRVLTVRQLIMLVIAATPVIFSKVSTNDVFFVIFSFVYIHFLSKFSFPSTSTTLEPPVFRGNKLLKYYVSIAGVVGILFPLIYIIHGIFQGDQKGIKAASPHLFLLASQVFMEGVSYSRNFSIPIRVFVPVFYNSRRIFSLVDWLRDEFLGGDELGNGDAMRIYVGRGLAIANMGLWCYNLFGFLLPVYLPKAFKKYYGYKD